VKLGRGQLRHGRPVNYPSGRSAPRRAGRPRGRVPWPALVLGLASALGLAGCQAGGGGWFSRLLDAVWPAGRTDAAVGGAALPPPLAATGALPAGLSRPGQAILLRGNNLVHGLSVFPGNRQLAWYAEYLLPGAAPDGTPSGADAFIVPVWYLIEPLQLPAAIGPGDCAAPNAVRSLLITGLTTELAGDGQVVSYDVRVLEYADYYLVTAWPAGRTSPALAEAQATTDGQACAFLRILAGRFAYFRSYAEDPAGLSFPATLSLQ